MSNTLSARIVFLIQWREDFLKIARFVLLIIKDAAAEGRSMVAGVPAVVPAACRFCFGRRRVVFGRIWPAAVVGGRRSLGGGWRSSVGGGSSVVGFFSGVVICRCRF